MTFTLDLQAFADSTNKKANLIVRKVIFDVDASLVYKSPVGDPLSWAINQTAVRYNSEGSDSIKIEAPTGYVGGRFRANWQYAESAAPTGELWTPIVGPFPDKNDIDVGEDAGGKMHYLVNNLPYGPKLEDGWSKQAPIGMVSITVLEFIPIVEAAAKAINL